MKVRDLVELAGRNLRESALRNALTTLGIGVGVASLVAMLALGAGLQAMATRRLEKSGLFDTVIVSSRRSERGPGRSETDENSASSPLLDEKARLAIERIPGVTEAAPEVDFGTEVRFDGKPYPSAVAGLPMSSRDREAFEGMQGAFFSSGSAQEAILRQEFAEDLLGLKHRPAESSKSTGEATAAVRPLIGKNLTLRYAERVSGAQGAEPATDAGAFSVVPRTATLRIVGIIDESPEGMRGPSGASVFIPLTFAESLHVLLPSDLREGETTLATPAYRTVSVRVKNPANTQAVEDAVKKMGFNAFSALDAAHSLQRFFAVLNLFLGIFGSLALAVASLGIVNTLVMAILERRREIGILKALGATDADVKKLFFAEAGAMGVLGGVLGVAMGWALGRAINGGTNVYLHTQNLPSESIWLVPWWLVAGAIGFAVVVSMVSGLYPAARAAKLDPVKALRYE